MTERCKQSSELRQDPRPVERTANVGTTRREPNVGSWVAARLRASGRGERDASRCDLFACPVHSVAAVVVFSHPHRSLRVLGQIDETARDGRHSAVAPARAGERCLVRLRARARRPRERA